MLSILMGASMGLTFLDLDLIAAAWTIFLQTRRPLSSCAKPDIESGRMPYAPTINFHSGSIRRLVAPRQLAYAIHSHSGPMAACSGCASALFWLFPTTIAVFSRH